MLVTSGSVATAMSAPVSARADSGAGGRAGRTAATGRSIAVGRCSWHATAGCRCCRAHTIRKVRFSSRARTPGSPPRRGGAAPQDQELQDVAPVRRPGPRAGRRRPEAGCRRRRTRMSSPGTARFRTFTSESLRKPIPSTCARSPPGRARRSRSRRRSGTAGAPRAVHQRPEAASRGRAGLTRRGRALHLVGRPGRHEASGAVAGRGCCRRRRRAASGGRRAPPRRGAASEHRATLSDELRDRNLRTMPGQR